MAFRNSRYITPNTAAPDRGAAKAAHVGQPNRGWDFRSPGHGQINFEEIIRELNRIEYDGPLSVEWEDSGMERIYGAREAFEFTKKMNFEPSAVAFDAALKAK